MEAWFAKNHQRATELWVRMFKKDSGTPSVNWNDCVEVALVWGWIDGQRMPGDKKSFLQRITPRRARSNWSKRNCAIAERLIAEGKMQPAGLEQVKAAKADGRWDKAYAGSSDMTIPDDFLKALNKSSTAKKTFAKLSKSRLFAIYYRLHSAKKPETRQRRMDALLDKLSRGDVDL